MQRTKREYDRNVYLDIFSLLRQELKRVKEEFIELTNLEKQRGREFIGEYNAKEQKLQAENTMRM